MAVYRCGRKLLTLKPRLVYRHRYRTNGLAIPEIDSTQVRRHQAPLLHWPTTYSTPKEENEAERKEERKTKEEEKKTEDEEDKQQNETVEDCVKRAKFSARHFRHVASKRFQFLSLP